MFQDVKQRPLVNNRVRGMQAGSFLGTISLAKWGTSPDELRASINNSLLRGVQLDRCKRNPVFWPDVSRSVPLLAPLFTNTHAWEHLTLSPTGRGGSGIKGCAVSLDHQWPFNYFSWTSFYETITQLNLRYGTTMASKQQRSMELLQSFARSISWWSSNDSQHDFARYLFQHLKAKHGGCSSHWRLILQVRSSQECVLRKGCQWLVLRLYRLNLIWTIPAKGLLLLSDAPSPMREETN